jgi:topoisomerase IV subunit B
MYIGRLGDGSNPMDGIYILLKEVIDCVSKVNTGGKLNDDVFQFSVGLNGIGTKAVNALSTEFEVVTFRDGKLSSRKIA